MSSSKPDVVKIIESQAELGADKWVSRWVKFTSDTVGLEAENTSGNKVNIIPPSGDHWVALDGCAWYTCRCQGGLKT